MVGNAGFPVLILPLCLRGPLVTLQELAWYPPYLVTTGL